MRKLLKVGKGLFWLSAIAFVVALCVMVPDTRPDWVTLGGAIGLTSIGLWVFTKIT